MAGVARAEGATKAREAKKEVSSKWSGKYRLTKTVAEQPAPPTGPEEYEVDANTLALWHFNENSGTKAYDETANNNDITLSNAAMWTTTAKMGAAAINPAALYIGTEETLLDVCPANGTIEMWFNPNVTIDSSISSNKTLMEKINGVSQGQYDIAFESGDGRVWFYNSKAGVKIFSTTAVWTAGTWYHIAATWGAGGMEIWINGIRENTNATTVVMENGTLGNYMIGNHGGGTTAFNGIIDEMRVSDIQRDTFNI
jgi:hypothetical protein